VTGWKNLAAGSDAGELGATCIAGFAVTTFVPSMPSAGPINKEHEPAAFSTTFPPRGRTDLVDPDANR